MSGERQAGQALVGAMVIMLILFALAGGVAVAASGVLQQGRARSAAITDLSAQSAAADAVSQVAGSTTQCPVPPSTATFPDIDADDLTTLQLTYPNPVSAQYSSAYCMRVDKVSAPTSGSLWADLQWMSRCGSVQLPQQHVTLFFDARVLGKGGLLYIDDQPPSAICLGALPRTACITSPQGGCVQCGKTINTDITLIAQASLDCDLSSRTSPSYLHVRNNSTASSPARVFTVSHDDNGGSMYLIATQLGSGAVYEESSLVVPPNGAANHLLYKAPLP